MILPDRGTEARAELPPSTSDAAANAAVVTPVVLIKSRRDNSYSPLGFFMITRSYYLSSNDDLSKSILDPSTIASLALIAATVA
jgi:hypothetical protein